MQQTCCRRGTAMQLPRVSSVQALTLSDLWPGFFHAEKLRPTWYVMVHLPQDSLLLQAGEKQKVSAEPTSHVHPQPCWISPFCPHHWHRTGTRSHCLELHQSRSSLGQEKENPLLWATDQTWSLCADHVPTCTGYLWWRGGCVGQGDSGELFTPLMCSLTTGADGRLLSFEE